MNQYDNAIGVLTAIAGTLADDPTRLAFYTDMKASVVSGNPKEADFGDYGVTLATVKAALPATNPVNATAWELSVAGIFKQVACFIEESNELEAPIAGNTAGTSHKDLIMAKIDVRIAAL